MKRQKIYPRICILKNWGTSYGFHLTTRKFTNGKEYHYINDVAGGSSALYAGLLKYDKVLEVNDVSIENENHKQIVKRILQDPNSVKLLVLKPEEHELFLQSGYSTFDIKPFATLIESPNKKPNSDEKRVKNIVKESNQNSVSFDENTENPKQKLESLVLRTDSWTPKEHDLIDEPKSNNSSPLFAKNSNIDNVEISTAKSKKLNPRQLSKNSSLNIKEKIKILDEL